MKFNATNVEVTAVNGNTISVEATPDDMNDILNQISTSDKIDAVGVGLFVSECDSSEILNAMNIDDVVEWLRNEGITVILD